MHKRGYPVPDGFMGLMPDGKYHKFASEADYEEAFDDAEEHKEED